MVNYEKTRELVYRFVGWNRGPFDVFVLFGGKSSKSGQLCSLGCEFLASFQLSKMIKITHRYSIHCKYQPKNISMLKVDSFWTSSHIRGLLSTKYQFLLCYILPSAVPCTRLENKAKYTLKPTLNSQNQNSWLLTIQNQLFLKSSAFCHVRSEWLKNFRVWDPDEQCRSDGG